MTRPYPGYGSTNGGRDEHRERAGRRARRSRDAHARLFFVDWEQSVPTLFSTLMLVVSALLLGLIAHARSGQANARHLLALSIVFSLLALGEFANLHE